MEDDDDYDDYDNVLTEDVNLDTGGECWDEVAIEGRARYKGTLVEHHDGDDDDDDGDDDDGHDDDDDEDGDM